MSARTGFKIILIVDDSQMARTCIRKCFEAIGFMASTYLEATDGEAALSLLRHGGVDLVVTDLNMPVMSGDRLLEWIRLSPKLAGTPVMVVSSLAGIERSRQLMQQGAQAVLFKPMTPIDLEQALVSASLIAATKDAQ